MCCIQCPLDHYRFVAIEGYGGPRHSYASLKRTSWIDVCSNTARAKGLSPCHGLVCDPLYGPPINAMVLRLPNFVYQLGDRISGEKGETGST